MFTDMMRFNDDLNGKFDDRLWSNHPMMWWAGGNQGAFWFYSFLWLITWVLIIIALIVLIRWLWKKGNKVR